MAVKFDYSSERAQLARLQQKIGGVRAQYLLLAITLCVAGAVVSFLLVGALGWLWLAVGSLVAMPYLWERGELRSLPAGPGDDIHDRLEGGLLALLPAKLTPKTLLQALSQVTSAQFVMARSGLSPKLLEEVYEDTEQTLSLIWSAVGDMAPAGIVSGATVLVAMVKVSPNTKQLLPHLQLDAKDVEAMSNWYAHLDELIRAYSTPRRTGGIARDLGFGYLRYLDRFGVNLTQQVTASGHIQVDVASHREALEFMKKTFSASGRQNVALVGSLGVGKTSVVRAFAEQLMDARSHLPARLRYRQIISLDAAALISAASGRGELEDLLNRLLLEAYHAKNVILCLDDAELFFADGVGSVDLSSVLLPVLEGGGLRIILTMDEQRWLQIASRNPSLAAVLNKFTITPASEQETMAVLQDQLIPVEFNEKVTYMYQSLRESLRLSERYLHDQAQPGKALRILTAAARNAQSGFVTASSVQQVVEQMQGVKVGRVNAEGEKEMLLNLESLIHKRMINQTHAVEVVSDALRRARAGVRNEQRPVGTFLFLGPTGTGKTELAKSLAAVYFSGEDHLVRVDLNEFVTAGDVSRLIADGAEDPMSLTAQIMKQPFSVILLDEIEKAHPSVLAALLQVLDEGILRDSSGREVSFRDSILIATSNAASEQIRHHVAQGEALEDFERDLISNLVASGEFRPEFLNRFDEIVLFKPLGKEELYQVIDLMIAGTNKTLETQKISVTITDEAKDKLVELGYDPQLGARPLRRVLQRNVESQVAKALLAGDAVAGQTITIDAGDIKK